MWNRAQNPEKVARDWHWAGSNVPVKRIHVRDSAFPDPLIACGLWTRAVITLPEIGVRNVDCDEPSAYLAFDPNTEYGRLYLCVPAHVRKAIKAAFWQPGERPVALDDLAHSIGGRQQGGYPEVYAQPVGRIDQIEYWARKYGYGQGAENGATFFHTHSRNPRPWLAVDSSGTPWIVGGDYDGSDTRGIVG